VSTNLVNGFEGPLCRREETCKGGGAKEREEEEGLQLAPIENEMSAPMLRPYKLIDVHS